MFRNLWRKSLELGFQKIIWISLLKRHDTFLFFKFKGEHKGRRSQYKEKKEIVKVLLQLSIIDSAHIYSKCIQEKQWYFHLFIYMLTQSHIKPYRYVCLKDQFLASVSFQQYLTIRELQLLCSCWGNNDRTEARNQLN